MRISALLLGLFLLVAPDTLRVYFIMPFPGSQEDVATDLRRVELAYWLHHNNWWLRGLGLTLVVGPALYILRTGGAMKRLVLLLSLIMVGTLSYLFNVRFMADSIFLTMRNKVLLPVTQDRGSANDLVIAVERNGVAHAYPIEIIGYHHQVLDTIGGEMVMVTYCTVCRTGRVYRPLVNGRPEAFRLVGMDHFNALFEDHRTESWWRQVSGECIAGPLKGTVLSEVPSFQLTRSAFAQRFPQGSVLQPDPAFSKEYASLQYYDEGTAPSLLEGRDADSWQAKSWVVGVVHNGVARAYDWSELQCSGSIKDLLAKDSIVITLMGDGRSFTAVILRHDTAAASAYGPNGEISVRHVVRTLRDTIPAYQEFWHSWRTFHPGTTRHVRRQ